MTVVYANRVKETTTTTGTGTLSLLGAGTGFQTFVAGIGNTNTTTILIDGGAGEWEVCETVVTDGTPDTLSRGALLASSTGSRISFSAGTKTVVALLPAERAIYRDDIGAVLIPLQPSFLAFNSATDTNQTGDATIATVDFDTEVFDRGGNFASDTFTAPRTGLYRFSASVIINALTASFTSGLIWLHASNRDIYGTVNNPGAVRDVSNQATLQVNALVDMDAGDTCSVQILVQGSTKTIGIVGNGTLLYTHFSGELVA
jgi:hypothetical protein